MIYDFYLLSAFCERWSADMYADDPHPYTVSHPVLSWPCRHLRTVCPMSSALTKRIVLTVEPKNRPYGLRDAQVRGLILRVQPSGHKDWIVTWAHGKRRTLGLVEQLSLDQARDQARQVVAECVQSGLPALAKSKPTSCTVEALLNDHFEPWAIAELKGGRKYSDRIRSVFPWLLGRQIAASLIPVSGTSYSRQRRPGPGLFLCGTAAVSASRFSSAGPWAADRKRRTIRTCLDILQVSPCVPKNSCPTTRTKPNAVAW